MSKHPHRDRVLAPPEAAPETQKDTPSQPQWTREAYAAALRGRRSLAERIEPSHPQ